MAYVTEGGSDEVQVFRTRAVRVAGLVDVTLGTTLLAVGAFFVGWRTRHNGLPIGLAMAVVALTILIIGLGRMTARLELTSSEVRWKWTFSRFSVALTDLDDADLVEKGSPASGASWAGFLGGGFYGVFVWWFLELAVAFFTSEPSLGPLELVVIKHHGGAVAVPPISAWSTRTSHSEANEAVRAIKAAVSATTGRLPNSAPRPAVLRYDAWDSIRDN
jgi:hypothetical protein